MTSVTGGYRLQWDPPLVAADGDTAARYVVFRFRTPSFVDDGLKNPKNILTLTGATAILPPPRIDSLNCQYYYAVAALDKNNNESGLSNVVTLAGALSAPILRAPLDGAQDFPRSGTLKWSPGTGASFYRIQLDTSGTFVWGSTILDRSVADTAAAPAGLKTQKTYE
jgi:hypothetical protein